MKILAMLKEHYIFLIGIALTVVAVILISSAYFSVSSLYKATSTTVETSRSLAETVDSLSKSVSELLETASDVSPEHQLEVSTILQTAGLELSTANLELSTTNLTATIVAMKASFLLWRLGVSFAVFALGLAIISWAYSNYLHRTGTRKANQSCKDLLKRIDKSYEPINKRMKKMDERLRVIENGLQALQTSRTT